MIRSLSSCGSRLSAILLGALLLSTPLMAADAERAMGTCDAVSGTLVPITQDPCTTGDPVNLIASWSGQVVPSGSQAIFLLVTGPEQTIRAGAFTPSFNVSAVGVYAMHTLVFNNTLDLSGLQFGVSVLNDIHVMLIQGGGTSCGSLDLVGASFNVVVCPPPCDAMAGGIVADQPEVCLEGGSATVSGTPDGGAVLPDGFALVFGLSTGEDQVIIAGDQVASFQVNGAGEYVIHPLVYDPGTFDPASIIFGETTIADLNALLIQGGGELCASLDLVGATIVVEVCNEVCEAQAGSLTAAAATVCLDADMVTISATANGDAVVPEGFQTIYFRTTGVDMVIEAANTVPVFEVTETGDHAIVTLVYDPATLDLGQFEFGVSTAYDINDFLIQGGGTICAGLDLAGAPISVVLCCDAESGSMTAVVDSICFPNGPVMISATANGDAVVPEGFEVEYILAVAPDGVIETTAAAPSFLIFGVGDFSIHALVYDPMTFDPALIEPGVSRIDDLHGQFIQGGGTICASVDVAGASIEVADCSPANDDCTNAVVLAIGEIGNCTSTAVSGDNTYATPGFEEDPGCGSSSSGIADVWYVFNSGANTSVSLILDPGNMTDRALTVTDACAGGTELVCELSPAVPIDVTTTPNTDYWIRVYSNLDLGAGGTFELCLSGAIPTYVCDGGTVTTGSGDVQSVVCQDGDPDILDFLTTSTSVEEYMFFVTDGADVIVTPIAGSSLDFNALPMGTYRVWGISYNGELEQAGPGNALADVTSTGECLEVSNDYVRVDVEICSGLATLDGSAWSLFPNPATGQFNVRYSGAETNLDIDLLDVEGRLVRRARTTLGNGRIHAMPLSDLAPGVYSVRISTGSATGAMRLMVQ